MLSVSLLTQLVGQIRSLTSRRWRGHRCMQIVDMAFSDQCVNLVLKTIYKLFYCQAQVQVHSRQVHNHSHTKDLGLQLRANRRYNKCYTFLEGFPQYWISTGMYFVLHSTKSPRKETQSKQFHFSQELDIEVNMNFFFYVSCVYLHTIYKNR